ncbi:hypothetical protein PISMIDRAFT_516523 [Pisolithus microcarpus 441]|uniref:Uncharacterized protein n=1 Tax=Pisolithus microcarpus 441 TaxID=765257 RepID=A0A0D0AAS0_9AGAM|nr:hypothetical protein BKA83DRAFT_516523 [Pisolithus microcarpus]KIK29058.1 hypothetical protein PISMIDRAFT_516523 [Pisolithus microcarpus 441]
MSMDRSAVSARATFCDTVPTTTAPVSILQRHSVFIRTCFIVPWWVTGPTTRICFFKARK